jgi:hypothetical protein
MGQGQSKRRVPMPVRQISLSLDNTPGQFSTVVDFLGENGINVIALSVADAADVSAVRFVANDPDKAIGVLKSQGYSVKLKEVLAVEVPKHPGGLNAILRPLKAANINVNYLYTCLTHGDKPVLIVDVDKMKKAISVLRKNWVHLLDEDLYSM